MSREQEIDSISAMEHWRLAEMIQDVSKLGWCAISVVVWRGEFVAFLQRDKPANPEFIG